MNLCEMGTPSLAYLGDAVWEVLVRRYLVTEYQCGAGELNTKALSFVSAPAQAKALERLLPLLTEEEASFVRRGRNISPRNLPHNATREQYRDATGLEVLFGALHLDGRAERICTLFSAALAKEETRA